MGAPKSWDIHNCCAMLFLSLGLFTTACGKLNLPAGAGQGGSYNPPVGVVDDNAGFYMRYISSDDYAYVVHRGADTPQLDCKAEEGERIDCYLEGKELDLYFQGVSLQYNVPSTMCDYVKWMPYYYWAWQPGTGATQVFIDTDQNGDVGIDTDAPGAPGFGTIDLPLDATCDYDYTGVDGPNCCRGTYTKFARTWDTDHYETETTTNVSWGGDWSACIAGPAVDSQPKSPSGFPEPVIYFSKGKGLNNKYEITSPIKKQKVSNIYLANYYDVADHGGTTPPQIITSALAYDVQCLDRAHEIKSEIRLYIRDWNTSSAFDDLFNDIGQHSVSGFEGAPWNSSVLNDFWDWKDFGLSFPQGSD